MITIDLQNRQAIYEQIVERFETLIVNGILEPDSQMPSVRSLAVELSINPNTIQRAYGVLEQEGYIYPVKGRGNFVSGNEDLKVRKQESLYASLGELVEKGKELDITCEMFVAKTRELYMEEGPGRMPGKWQRSRAADLTGQEPGEPGGKPKGCTAGSGEKTEGCAVRFGEKTEGCAAGSGEKTADGTVGLQELAGKEGKEEAL